MWLRADVSVKAIAPVVHAARYIEAPIGDAAAGNRDTHSSYRAPNKRLQGTRREALSCFASSVPARP
jgi:hypothetical protein